MSAFRKTIVLLTIFISTYSCQTFTGQINNHIELTDIEPIRGKVEFPLNSLQSINSNRESDGAYFGIKATQSDIATFSTISLIYPSDHSSNPNVTIASGLTDVNGNFIINTGTLFAPTLNSVYILEAVKRRGGNGNALMSLRTFIMWDGITWKSLTAPGIYINTKTTALSIIQENSKSSVSTLDTIGKIDIVNGIAQAQNIHKIVFTSERDGNNEIYAMNPGGTNQTRLTNNSALDYYPSFSADGSKIVFQSERDGNSEIYIMNFDGTNQTRLTNNTIFDGNAIFSTDGSKIVFRSDLYGNPEILIMDSDGTNQIRLTNNSIYDFNPNFSPNSSKISFETNRDGNYEIYEMNTDGTNQGNITNNSSNDLSSSFSPDGSKIAFQSDRDGNYEIYIMNHDGTNQTRLTNNPFWDGLPSFSADGKIIFSSNRDGNNQIYVMNVDGSNQKNLTNNSIADYQAKYSQFFIKSSAVNYVDSLVKEVLISNNDPFYYIKFIDGQFKIVNPPDIGTNIDGQIGI